MLNTAALLYMESIMKSFRLDESVRTHWFTILSAWVAFIGMCFLVGFHPNARLEYEIVVSSGHPVILKSWTHSRSLSFLAGASVGLAIGGVHCLVRRLRKPATAQSGIDANPF